MALTVADLGYMIEEKTGIKPGLVKRVLGALAEVAEEEIAAGEDFTVPKIARIRWAYSSARKKGDQYKKGDTVQGIGGVTRVAEADSPARKASVRLRAVPTAHLKKHAPRTRDVTSQSDFLRSSAGKNIASRSKR